MASSGSLSGKILTVTGPISPDQLGTTHTHEHAVMDYEFMYIDVEKEAVRQIEREPMTLQNHGWVKQHPYSNRQNLQLYGNDWYSAVEEDLKFFKKNGGNSIVECTTMGIGRNIKKLKELSESSGINIISGTGFYLPGILITPDRPNKEILSSLNQKSEEEISAMLVSDIMEGADGTDVRCGVIGEVAISHPMTEVEKTVIKAVASAQNQLGCPVIFHPEDFRQCPFDIMRIFQEAGGLCEKTVMSHLDYIFFKPEDYLEFAEFGTYLELDFFGIETSNWDYTSGIDFINDAQRIQLVKKITEEGLSDRVVIAHDVHTRHRLMKFGGHGYSHILLNVVPKMLKRGIFQETIDKILTDNPKRWLTFK
ncbi:N-acetyltaurine hydrolase-like [Ptychodera flava]|uniref:N-acetyltaurine hydrolase-like n=1 Tax=Ptychodera flava TaxID=63121 RepID=UPI00396A511A